MSAIRQMELETAHLLRQVDAGRGTPSFERLAVYLDQGERAPIYRVRDALLDLEEEQYGPYAGGAIEASERLRYLYENQLNPGTGALGPSMSYANPPPGSPPDTDLGDGTEFTMQTCDHEQLPPQMVEAIESSDEVAQQTSDAPELGDDFADEMLLQEIILRDQGPFPPPWAIYQETFNYQEKAPSFSAEVLSADFGGYGERLRVANPLPKGIFNTLAPEAQQVIKREGSTLGYLIGDNAKMAKGGGLCWLAGGVSLLPWTVAGVGNLCPWASKGCATGCLNMSGQAEVYKDSIRRGRSKRTELFFKHRAAFVTFLEYDINGWVREASKGFKDCPEFDLALRMNVLSDLPWEQMKFQWPDGMRETVIERYSGKYSGFPRIQFYDYTKSPNRMMNFLRGGFPDNYYLTFSWSEINAEHAFNVLDAGGSVAIAFDYRAKKDPLPAEYCGYPVINADETDFRFLDRELFFQEVGQGGFFCGLRMKGRQHINEHKDAKAEERAQGLPPGTLTGGFFQYGDEVHLSNEDPETYKAHLIALGNQRLREQQLEGFRAE